LIYARKVHWYVKGDVNWTIDDEALVLWAEVPGYVNITAKCLWVTASTSIYVDYELVLNPTHVLMPVGTSYEISVEHALPVTLSSHGNQITFNPGANSITANEIGVFDVQFQYRSQLKVVSVVVTTPETFYVENQTGREHVLDPDGQEYTDPGSGINGTQPGLKYYIAVGEPDDTATRHLFDDEQQEDDLLIWGFSQKVIKVKPKGSVGFPIAPGKTSVSVVRTSPGLTTIVNAAEGGKAYVIVSADGEFTGKGKIVIEHLPTLKQIEVVVLAKETNWFILIVGLVVAFISGGYIVSHLT
jgi:hypothetical protein